MTSPRPGSHICILTPGQLGSNPRVVKEAHVLHEAGFTVTGKISRKEFGLTWNAVTESGGVVVGDEIKVNAEVQLIKQS